MRQTFDTRHCKGCGRRFQPKTKAQVCCTRECVIASNGEGRRSRKVKGAEGKAHLPQAVRAWQYAALSRAQQAAKVPSSSWWARCTRDEHGRIVQAHPPREQWHDAIDEQAERMLSQAPSPTPRTLEREW